METKLVCGNKFPFRHNTISLPVFLENVPPEIVCKGDTFLINSFLHVSLVCIGKIIEKHNISIPDFENKAINDFCEFAERNEITLTGYTNDFRYATRDDLKTIIVMCK